MVTYLEKISSTIRKKQTEQILKLLSKQKSTGQIRTIEEFTTKLDNLVRELTQTTLTPTLKVTQAEAKTLTSSEAHNFVLERTEDDLYAAFGEAYNIDQVQKAHQSIVKDVLLKNLERATAELEAKISLYEFINNEGQGYTQSIFSTFKESRDDRLHRASVKSTTATNAVSLLFIDPRTGKYLQPDEDALIDPVGERLTLGVLSSDKATVRNVTQVFDSDTVTSSQPISPKNSNIKNMLDGTSGTYWIQGVLVNNDEQSLTTKLQFDFSALQTVNLLQLQPANQFPFSLEKIYYLDISNVVQLLQSPSLLVNRNMSHSFPTISTSTIILEFKSTTSVKANFVLEVPFGAGRGGNTSLSDQQKTQISPDNSIIVSGPPAGGGRSSLPPDASIAFPNLGLSPSNARVIGPSSRGGAGGGR